MSRADSYHERLYAPVSWWALAGLFLASVAVAFAVATPMWLTVAVVVVLVVLEGALLVGYGSARVEVRDGMLTAGRARVPVAVLGRADALDRDAGRRIAGVEADARAYLLLRPYVKSSVRVSLEDRADPTPYWLLSTRRPSRLVAALDAARATARQPGGRMGARHDR
ncbi:MAG: DUF3093 domain-containing protein [Nocardioidaceae bacterium]